jgi:hypothetical protein
MGAEEDYRPETWTRIKRLPFLAAMAMEGAGRSGIAGSASERLAMVRALAEGRNMFPGNALIEAIVPEGAREDQHILADAALKHDEIMDCLAEMGIEDHAGLLSHLYALVPKVLSQLEAHEAPETLQGYKDWVLYLAKEVAKAGKEGDFLGFGGEWFSAQERDIYDKLCNLFQ